MKIILAAAILAAFAFQAEAQSDTKLPDLPAAAGSEAPLPTLPAPASTYDSVDPASLGSTPSMPQRTMTDEEMKRLKQDENWLVEGMQKKQQDDAAAALAKKAEDLKIPKEPDAKEATVQPGEMSTFKPVVIDNSLASLNPNQPPGTNPSAAKKKNTSLDPLSLQGIPTGSNPLTTSSSALVQPILGPSRQPMNSNVSNLNPGLGIAPLPGTGIKKLSSNPNFIPDGYADSWTKQQEQSPYAPLVQPQVKTYVPPVPVTPRPTFKDLANTIPDPTQVR